MSDEAQTTPNIPQLWLLQRVKLCLLLFDTCSRSKQRNENFPSTSEASDVHGDDLRGGAISWRHHCYKFHFRFCKHNSQFKWENSFLEDMTINSTSKVGPALPNHSESLDDELEWLEDNRRDSDRCLNKHS
jgi:hypothetical protein